MKGGVCLCVHMHWTQLPDTPNAPGFGGAFAGTHSETLLMGGGSNFPDKALWDGGAKVWHDSVFTLTAGAKAWKEIGKLPRPLGYGASVSIRQGLLCLGGADAVRHYNDAFVLSVDNGKLHIDSFPSLPRPLAYAAAALVGSKVIIAGGTDRPEATSASATGYVIDLANLNAGWKELPAFGGTGRMLAQAAGTKDNFFLFGGVALKPGVKGPEREYLQDGYAFRLGSKEWRKIADLPHPVAAAATPCPVVGPIVALISGDDGSLVGKFEPAKHPGFSKGILTYDTQFNAWATSGEAPVGRVTLPCAKWNGGFVILNGESSPGVRSPQAWHATA